MKRKLNSVVLFFCITFSFAQIDAKFIKHLSENNLFREHKTYLNAITQSSDSVYYFKAKFNLQYPNDSLFVINYFKSKLLCHADTLLVKQSSIYFLKNSDKKTKSIWFNSLSEYDNTESVYFNTVYKATFNPNQYSKDNFPLELQRSYLQYKRAYNKKPFVAAVFSAILPGSGKLYAGKTKTFFLTFLLSAAYAVQTYESSQKLGIRHPLTIINLGAFSVFYLSNIYGSYRAVIDSKKENKQQFIIDATNFYN